MNQISHKEIDKQIVQGLRWSLFLEVNFEFLVQPWYAKQPPFLTEPMSQLDESTMEAYYYEP